MDINSKNNNSKVNKNITKDIKNIFKYIYNKLKNISVNKRIAVISICIGFLPLLFGIFNNSSFINEKDKLNDYFVRDEIETVSTSLDALNKYISDSNGTLRESAINDEIDKLKIENRKIVEGIKLGDESDSDLKLGLENAKKEYNKSDDEYRKQAIENIKDNVKLMNDNLKRAKNIEYYMKSTDGNIIRNIYGKNEDSILSQTTSNKNDYMLYAESLDHSFCMSESMKCFSDLMYADNTTCKVIRVSESLKKGDDIYNAIKDARYSNIRNIASSVLIVLDILFILIFTFVRKKDLDYKQNAIERFYSELFIEVKIFIIISVIILFKIIYEKINDYISWYDYYDSEYYGGTIVESIIFSIIIYLIITYIYNLLYKKSYLRNKSLMLKLFRRAKKANVYLSKRKSIYLKFIIIVMKLLLDYIVIADYNNSIPYGLDWIYYNSNLEIITMIDVLATLGILAHIICEIINIYMIDIAIDNITNGDYSQDIKTYGVGITRNVAKNIKNIQSGFSEALDEAVKSEKMKTELITNVSHDLKTPLTSIINYVDLLSKDNVTQEDRKKYLEVLNDRSLRLKVLIEDLFEAAKATSGAIEYHLENLDPVALLRQTLGEFEDKIESCRLTIIKNIPENKLSIIADGKKTFRIMQNLMSNIIKYSMKSSRVYIDVVEEEQYVLIVFKNISESQLNFTEEEILERFKRGDSSRTTEGNGLGLSIAKSLTEGQGGLFKIIIDGDLFKVEVRFRKNIAEN